MSAPPAPPASLLSRTAVAVLNRMLAREAWARERLQPYAGRVARFELGPFSLVFAIASDGRCAAADPAAALAPHVTLAIDAAVLPQALADPKAVLRNVRLSGDAEFAQALGQVLPNLPPEPEEELAPFFGDALAVRLVGFARMAFAQVRDAGGRFATSTVDYFVAENPMLADRAAVDAFAAGVVTLRDAVERLDKRVVRLEQARG
jgi:ubiquinone biosynthesis protein UbiJ